MIPCYKVAEARGYYAEIRQFWRGDTLVPQAFADLQIALDTIFG